jgi:C-terminal processing protease CtpA/Prc
MTFNLTLFGGSMGRRLVISAAMALLTVFLGTSTLSLATPVATFDTTVAPVEVAPFDGSAIYAAAFEALRDNHVALQDADARAAFVKAWQNRHLSDGALSTEKGTDQAVFEMTWSLGQRFDYYNPPAANEAEGEKRDPTLVGVGVFLSQKGLGKAIKAMGDKPKKEEVEALKKISDSRPIYVVEEPAASSPAGQGGIKKGDVIVAVDGVPSNGKTIAEAIQPIGGKAGTNVTLSILRKVNGVEVRSDVILTRALVTLPVVHSEQLGAVAYVSLSDFVSTFASQEMEEALESASKTAKALILDLRDNLGGDLAQVMKIAQMVLPHGIIVQRIERAGDDMVTITHSVDAAHFIGTSQSSNGSRGKASSARVPLIVPKEMPVVVLINEDSASASEILAGALQANGRAVIVGQPSHGKGVGQTVVPLPFNRNMHVTSFEFRPGAKAMDWVGIVPDLEVTLPEDTDLVDDPGADTQLARAQEVALSLLAGDRSLTCPQAEVALRAAELKAAHEAEFAKEVEMRRQELAASNKDDDAAASNQPTN